MRAPTKFSVGTFVADMTTTVPRKMRKDPPLKVPDATVCWFPTSTFSLDPRRLGMPNT
jgi:hypothetical protein